MTERRNPDEMQKPQLRWSAIGVFALTLVWIWWLAGARLVWINDEGIYLDGARRLLAGQALYRDVFVLTGPGAFWNLAVVFRLAGETLAAARAVLAVDIAVLAACMYWLAAKLHSRTLGWWLTWFFLALLSRDAGSLTVNHRWDSAAMAVLGVTLLFEGVASQRRTLYWAAGAAAAYAAWITPPVLLILAPILLWSFAERRWQGVRDVCTGILAVSTLAGVALAVNGSLVPMIHQFVWTTSQYGKANRFPYGGIIGGYPAIFKDADGIEWWLRAVIVFFIALPAVAPLVAVVTWVVQRRLWKTPLTWVVLCMIALVLSASPRLDVAHLLFAAPLAYVTAGVGLARLSPPGTRGPLVMALSLVACVMLWSGVSIRLRTQPFESRMGKVWGEPTELALVQELEKAVPPGSSFFAFPYLPMSYFLTRGVNPTIYSFLQPGMMADSDEDRAWNALRAQPPATILYVDVPPESYLRLFPSSDPTRLRMRKIEAWLAGSYVRDESFSKACPGFELLRQR